METRIESISNVDWDYVRSQADSALYFPESLSVYHNLDLLTVRKNQQLLALWPIPFQWEHGKKIARREIRLLPYHGPILFKRHVLDQSNLMASCIEYLQQNYHAVDLPLSPGLHNLAKFSAAGFYVEWRNTHLFTLSHSINDHMHAKAKNHIQSAKKKVSIQSSQDGEKFDFDLGIVVHDASHRAMRKRLACALVDMGHGIVFTASVDGCPVGQALVVHDHKSAYLFHSWFQRNEIRGVPSLLISMAAHWALNVRRLQFFDLEGSIIPAVDRFFTSLGGLQTPYAYIQWCKDKKEMLSMIETCIFLPLRLENIVKKKR